MKKGYGCSFEEGGGGWVAFCFWRLTYKSYYGVCSACANFIIK